MALHCLSLAPEYTRIVILRISHPHWRSSHVATQVPSASYLHLPKSLIMHANALHPPLYHMNRKKSPLAPHHPNFLSYLNRVPLNVAVVNIANYNIINLFTVSSINRINSI
jgi:hypothetical protein